MSSTQKYIVQLLVVFAFCAPSIADVPTTRPTENLFGAFNLNMQRRPAADQVKLLSEVGYPSMMILWEPAKGVKQLIEFQETPQIKSGSMKLVAALVYERYDKPIDETLLAQLFDALHSTDTYLWLMLDGSRHHDELMIQELRKISDLAQSHRVTVVFYPHFGQYCPTTELSLPLIKAANRPNLFTSIHLCHELKAHNDARIPEIVKKASPYLAMASINGAYNDRSDEIQWSKSICPLDEGDFDVKPFLRALHENNYHGPILLHTYGLKDAPEIHYPRSLVMWKKLMKELGWE
jgi:hypothetical protein